MIFILFFFVSLFFIIMRILLAYKLLYMNTLRILISCIFVLFVSMNLPKAQVYQLPNGNFESWNNNVPSGWNTFNSATGTYASFASSNHHSQETGHSGNYCVKIYSTSILGVVANGNMTTGRINAGAMSAASSSNYNFSDRSNSYAQVFNGTPDSMYVWTKMTAASSSTQATVRAYIHGNTDFIDPNDCNTPSLYKGKAAVIFTPHSTWTQQKTAFIYDGSSSVNYILITMTTNITPGSGAANDAVYVDDLEFIYSAWLTDIKANGVTLPGFRKDVFDYYVEYPRGTNPSMALPTITYTKEVSDANVVVTTNYTTPGSIDGATQIITSTAEDGITIKTYRIHYSIIKSNNNTLLSFTYDTNNVSHTVAVTDTNISIVFPAGFSSVPTISNCVLADTAARATITQANSANGTATIKVTAENGDIKTYHVAFSVALSTNAYLSAIYYNGTPISTFNKDTLTYDILLPSGTILTPYVTATTEWPGLTPAISQASTLPGTATITVTAEDGVSQKVYTIHFSVGISTNANLSWIKYNNIPITTFHADTLTYHIELPYGTTTANVTAAPVNATATVAISQAPQIPGAATIHVTAEDTNYQKTYTVDFSLGLSNDATLSALTYHIGFGSVSVPYFNPLINNYSIALPEGTTTTPVVAATATDSHAVVSITQPDSPNGTATIVVTAENGNTVKTYTIDFSVTLSTNANLDSLFVDNVFLAEFNPNTTTYSISMDTAVMPTVTVVTSHEKATYLITYPQTIPGQIQIIVKAEDTSVTKIYKLNLTMTASNNADLVDLAYQLNNVDYTINNFHTDTLIYYVTLPSQTVATPLLTYQTADAGARVTVTQPLSPNGVGIVMVISADTSNFKVYQVYFSVAVSTDATLASLSYQGNPIQNFDADSIHYYIELPYYQNIPDSISATAQSEAAMVYIRQAESYNDTAIVRVIAEDGITTKDYYIYFSRQLSPIATLSQISYTLNNQDSIVNGFDSSIFNYTVSIAEEELSIPVVNYTLSDSRSHAYFRHVPNTINDTAKIVVVAENNIDSNIYEIAFYYTPSSNTRLDSLFVNGVAVENFHADTLTYNIILPWAENNLPIVTAHQEWSNASIQTTQSGSVFGTAQIRVIAENLINQRTYTIHFLQGSNVDLSDLTYTLGQTDTIGFHSQDTIYHVMLPIATTTAPTLNYTLIDSRSAVTVKNAATPNDTAYIRIVGWDQLQVKTYYVIFEVELSQEALLTDLKVDGTTIADFNSDTLQYAIEYPFGYNQIPIVSATASQLDATIIYQQISAFPGQAVIKVLAGDTSIYRTYTIDFTVEPGNNNYLTTITINGDSLADFDKTINSYLVELEYGTSVVPMVAAFAEDSRASVSIRQASTLADTAFVTVTAINGDINIYSVAFSVAKNPDATLSDLFINGERLENFVSTTRNYKYPVLSTYEGIPVVTVVTTDSEATYQIIPAEDIPGQTKIEVTAANGVDQQTYRINFYIDDNLHVGVNSEEDEFCVYPNPVNEQIKIRINDNAVNSIFVLFDMQGKQIYATKLDNSLTTISATNILKGVYFYQIRNQQGILKTGKIVKL